MQVQVGFATFPIFGKEFDVLEFYAGRGHLTRYCKLAHLRTGSLDIMYQMQSGRYRSNPMDILSHSGFAFLGTFSDFSRLIFKLQSAGIF